MELIKKIIDYFLGAKKLKQELLDLKRSLQKSRDESRDNWVSYINEREKIHEVEREFVESFKHISNRLDESQKETTEARLLLRQIANHETTNQGIDKLKEFLKK